MVSDKTIRTFGDLMRIRSPMSYCSHCKRCQKWGHFKCWHYSTRATICEECATKAKDELLPKIARAERRARSYVAKHTEISPQFIASLSGASVQYVQQLVTARDKS